MMSSVVSWSVPQFNRQKALHLGTKSQTQSNLSASSGGKGGLGPSQPPEIIGPQLGKTVHNCLEENIDALDIGDARVGVLIPRRTAAPYLSLWFPTSSARPSEEPGSKHISAS